MRVQRKNIGFTTCHPERSASAAKDPAGVLLSLVVTSKPKPHNPQPITHIKNTIRYLAYAYLLGIVVLAFVPFGGINARLHDIRVLSLRSDYLIHFLVFLPLLPLWRMVWPRHHALMVFLLGMAIAASAEFVQYILPYRSFNVNDLIANLTGASAGLLIFCLLRRLSPEETGRP